jgi:hypothetical protein
MIFNYPRAYIHLKQTFSVRYATPSFPDGVTAHNIANIKRIAWDPNLEASLCMFL